MYPHILLPTKRKQNLRILCFFLYPKGLAHTDYYLPTQFLKALLSQPHTLYPIPLNHFPWKMQSQMGRVTIISQRRRRLIGQHRQTLHRMYHLRGVRPCLRQQQSQNRRLSRRCARRAWKVIYFSLTALSRPTTKALLLTRSGPTSSSSRRNYAHLSRAPQNRSATHAKHTQNGTSRTPHPLPLKKKARLHEIGTQFRIHTK